MRNISPELITILSCPNCRTGLRKTQNVHLLCPSCQEKFPVLSGIPLLLPQSSNLSPDLMNSQKGYDQLHRQQGGVRIDDGSYEFFAAVARGNKTLDIACGQGWVEKLAPDTVGLDFSLNSLTKAQRNGARHLVCGVAEKLPFANNSFEVVICAGSLEHFTNPLAALKEMARTSKIQVLTVHRKLPVPLANLVRKMVLKVKGIKDQPIDNPLSWTQLKALFKEARLQIIFHGYWSYPMNLQFLSTHLPKSIALPSCYFIVSRTINPV